MCSSDLNTGLAGDGSSFARSMTTIAAPNEERMIFRRFCSLESASMVEEWQLREKGAAHRLCGRTRTLIRMGGHFVVAHLV